jgi:pimeloyl-ACP methyl ester carboxylesterase
MFNKKVRFRLKYQTLAALKKIQAIILLSILLIFTLKASILAQVSQHHKLSATIDFAQSFQKKDKLLSGRKGRTYQIFLENYQSNSLKDKPTWLVIHGFGHSPSNLEDQELQKNLKASGMQVLQVDWSSITKRSIWSLWSAAGFIPSVADFVADFLIESTSLSGKNINCIGHSFGSYICWEIAKRIENFNQLVALEPASKKGTSLPWKKFYDVSKVNFSEHTTYSWSFCSSDLNSEKAALTSDASFLIEYRDYPDDRHNDVIGFLSTLIRRNSKGEGGSISRVLDVTTMDEKTIHPWTHDKLDYEGTIVILNENDTNQRYRWLPVSLHHNQGVLQE